MVKYSKAELNNAAKTIRKQIKAGKGLPKTLKIKGMDNKEHNLSITEYLGLFQQKNIFILKNGREANYVSDHSKCSTLPIAQNYQDNGYTCCPTSLSMATMCLFGYVSESKCAKTLGTVYGSGTSPSDLVANAPKLGYTATKIGRNYQSVLKSLQKGKPVVAHIQTRPATCLGYRGDYGHYVLIYWCRKNQYFIADPTKGMIRCSAKILDKATNGRSINYYSIGIK